MVPAPIICFIRERFDAEVVSAKDDPVSTKGKIMYRRLCVGWLRAVNGYIRWSSSPRGFQVRYIVPSLNRPR